MVGRCVIMVLPLEIVYLYAGYVLACDTIHRRCAKKHNSQIAQKHNGFCAKKLKSQKGRQNEEDLFFEPERWRWQNDHDVPDRSVFDEARQKGADD